MGRGSPAAGALLRACGLGGEALTERQEELAWAVLVEVVLLAGGPPYNAEAAADGEENGVGLASPPGNSRALRVRWRQDAAAATDLPADLGDGQQTAMRQALRTILAAHQFWIEDGPLSEAPIVRGPTRPEG